MRTRAWTAVVVALLIGLVVVDTRVKAAYNGWPLDGVKRGGHIKGAVDFPADWAKNVADDELAKRLKGLGYKDVLVYDDFKAWAADSGLPMERLTRYERLVYPQWLNALIAGKNPPTYDGRDYKIFEVSWGPAKEYNKGHIPGAIYLDTDDLEGLPYWDFWPDGRLVSIRSWDEFIGKTGGYSYIKRAGGPKGAVWGHAGTDNSNMADFHDVDGSMRNYHEIEAMWKEWDIARDNKVSFYCGTGWRAAETCFYAYLMGWPDISLYDGGWFQWEMDPKNPVQTGDPRKHNQQRSAVAHIPASGRQEERDQATLACDVVWSLVRRELDAKGTRAARVPADRADPAARGMVTCRFEFAARETGREPDGRLP